MKLRLIILRRDGYRCQMDADCDRPADTVDHWIPITDGGNNHPANLRAACAHHNYSGGAMISNTRRRPPDETPLFQWTKTPPIG